MKKPIKGYEGIYEVDEFGNVYSLERTFLRKTKLRNGIECMQKIKIKQKILTNYKAKNGYEVVNLSGISKNKQKYVHFLVAQAFIGERPNRYTINHKDGIKTNNHVTNLEYVTYAENNQHAIDMGLNNHNISDYTIKIPVKQICPKTNKVIAVFESSLAAEKALKTRHVSCAAKGKRKTAGKYKWEYV
jgi:hypothetical protein